MALRHRHCTRCHNGHRLDSGQVALRRPAVQSVRARLRLRRRLSCLKAGVVEKDERELTGLRAILNYGHTFAHAFETVAGYGTWLHGEAVSAGMVCASRLAERRGLIATDLTQRQVRLLEAFGLPVKPERWVVDDLLAVMRSDKKAEAGQVALRPSSKARGDGFAGSAGSGCAGSAGMRKDAAGETTAALPGRQQAAARGCQTSTPGWWSDASATERRRNRPRPGRTAAERTAPGSRR